MRLFLAVELDERARHAAVATSERLMRELVKSGAAREGEVKWVPPETMHVTIHFLGDVADTVLPVLRDALTPPLDTPPFILALGGIGVFPPTGPPRVVWIGVTTGVGSLVRLHEGLGKLLRSLDLGVAFETERRSYSPHLTLGRFRRPGADEARRIATRSRTPELPESRVGHVTLFESRPSPNGQIHVALQRTPLAGAG